VLLTRTADLLSTGLGTFIYHLLILLMLEAMFGIAFIGWRYTDNPDHRRSLWVFAGVLALRVPLLFGELLDLSALVPVISGIEVGCVVLLGWGFTAPVLSRRGRWLYLLCGLGLVLVFIYTVIFMPVWSSALAAEPDRPYAGLWQQPFWHIIGAVVSLSSVVVLRRPTKQRDHALPRLGFAALGFGLLILLVRSSLSVSMPGSTHPGLLNILGRLAILVAHALLAAAVYQSVLQDMWAYREELQTVSEEALRRTQELLSLVEITRTIGESLDLDAILDQVAESITTALNADRCAVFLVAPEDFGTVYLASQYVFLQREDREAVQRAADLADQPVLDHALKRRKQLILNDAAHKASLKTLYELLDSREVGPAIVQPLLHQHRLSGVLVVGNDRSQRAFEPSEGRLCQSIAVQLAAAVENARLYQDLEIQTNRLARLLQMQEDGVRRQTAILESISDGVIFSDQDGHITVVNAAAERILGTRRDRIQGRSLERLMAHRTSGIQTDWREVIELGTSLQTVFELEDKVVHASAAPVLTEAGDRLGVVAVLRNITRETKAERAKSTFITAISHELRTPITAIRGYAEALSTGMVGAVSQTQAHFLRIIRDNAMRMVSLAENLIAASEIEKGFLTLKYEETDLHLLIGDVVSSFKSQIDNRQLKVSLELDEGLPLIEADPSRVRQILDNLVSNAVKFTYPGGHITVGAQLLREEGDRVPMHCKIWVEDNGIGISPEEQTHIWERFYRPASPLAEEASGLGMGLSIVKSLVEAHGGRVWMESTPSEGSTFTVLLPVTRPQRVDHTSA